MAYLLLIKGDIEKAGATFKEAYTTCNKILNFFSDKLLKILDQKNENTFISNLHIVEKAQELRYVDRILTIDCRYDKTKSLSHWAQNTKDKTS